MQQQNHQRIIYSGQLLQDDQKLRDILRKVRREHFSVGILFYKTCAVNGYFMHKLCYVVEDVYNHKQI